MMARFFVSTAVCLCTCPTLVHAWHDLMPPVQFLKPKHVKGLVKPPAPVLDILKRPPPFGTLERPFFKQIDGRGGCCRATTAQCIACTKGIQMEDLCRRVPHLRGCIGHPNDRLDNPMLKDMLKEAMFAAGGRKDAALLVEGVEQYVDKHPGALKNATNTALTSISKIFSRSRKGQTAQAASQTAGTPMEPLPATAESMAISSAPDHLAVNPWMVAGITTLIAAVCAGVSVGALCYARVQRVQMAREPLLAGAPTQGTLPDEAAGGEEVAA
mmetsp:Transcript_129220/g.258019  ORF Transcript_129220/g.258019 Transcript_129220/m.258019 type:complete len:271 (-) Transcript_129220:273-1085(-)